MTDGIWEKNWFHLEFLFFLEGQSETLWQWLFLNCYCFLKIIDPNNTALHLNTIHYTLYKAILYFQWFCCCHNKCLQCLFFFVRSSTSELPATHQCALLGCTTTHLHPGPSTNMLCSYPSTTSQWPCALSTVLWRAASSGSTCFQLFSAPYFSAAV